MDVKLKVAMTPNPNALKFITNVNVINHDRVSLDSEEKCASVPLAKAIFALDGVTQVHFFENVITVTQSGSEDWGALEEQIKQVMVELLPAHDPDFHTVPETAARVDMGPEVGRINDILDRTVRPALQGDGGDLEVLGLEDDRLFVRYQGACGGCPSASAGTLQAIEGILKDEFNPNIEVHAM
jgi:Fe-S cluster biogenesis protein NfuA